MVNQGRIAFAHGPARNHGFQNLCRFHAGDNIRGKFASNTGAYAELRLTQLKKAAGPRRRVLDAALSCLIDRGYSNPPRSKSPTVQVFHAAHSSTFPKKDALLTSAVEYLIELRIADSSRQVAGLPKGASWTAAIAAFSKVLERPFFRAELAVAAAPILRCTSRSARSTSARTIICITRSSRSSSPRPKCARFELISWTIFFIYPG